MFGGQRQQKKKRSKKRKLQTIQYRALNQFNFGMQLKSKNQAVLVPLSTRNANKVLPEKLIVEDINPN